MICHGGYWLQSGRTMDIEYTWILYQGKNCRQFRLLTCSSFNGQILHPAGGKVMG